MDIYVKIAKNLVATNLKQEHKQLRDKIEKIKKHIYKLCDGYAVLENHNGSFIVDDDYNDNADKSYFEEWMEDLLEHNNEVVWKRVMNSLDSGDYPQLKRKLVSLIKKLSEYNDLLFGLEMDMDYDDW